MPEKCSGRPNVLSPTDCHPSADALRTCVSYFCRQVKVMQSQLRLFHVAVTNYFSGNTPALKKTLQHLSAPNLACGDGV